MSVIAMLYDQQLWWKRQLVDGRFKVSPIYKSCSDIKKKIKPQSLAPTKNAAKYHFLRIHLQVIEWKTLMGVELNLSACGNCNGVECETSVEQDVSPDEDSVQSDEEQRNIFDIFDV